ncbi:hypothetical protein GCM10027073_36420 [Streptomyces chlorus]|uniref:TetR family transcriptional regulator n=1 Tax=Streptomyces chlorus TaxID=887452 RepID=A0ABW1E3K5_9ACTN
MRAIAARAGVDTGLIRHFFGDKNGLIAATLAAGTTAPDQLATALRGTPDGVGERLARAYFELWESPEAGPTTVVVFRSAITSPKAMGMLRESFGTQLQERVLGTNADTDRAKGVALAVSHLLGVAVARYVIEVEPLAGMDRDELVHRVTPAVQQYLTGQTHD